MFQIAKEFTFSASHCLDHLPESHPCHRLHGHNYTVTLIFESELLGADLMIVDYRKLGQFKKWLDRTLDHRHLDDVLVGYTTAESIAAQIFDTCKERWPRLMKKLKTVRVSETPKTWAEYSE